MINLHAIVRGNITAVHPDETVTLYRSTGQDSELGRITPTYAAPQVIQAQIQSLGADELARQEAVNITSHTCKAYLFADRTMPPAGLIRPISRNGDMIQRADGSWWLVTGAAEDFSDVGWVCVNITQQLEPPACIKTYEATHHVQH